MTRQLLPSPSMLFSSGLGLTIFALLSGLLSIWQDNPNSFKLTIVERLIIGLAPTLLGWFLAKHRASKLEFIPEGFSISLLAIFFTDWLANPYGFMRGLEIRGELLLGAIAGLCFVRKLPKTTLALLPIVLLLFIICFLSESAARLLFADDHAVFIYRLSLLKNHFPQIPFYNPLWNAGIDARDFFATGALNSYFIFWPFIETFEVVTIYNYLILALLFGLAPAASFLAARLLRFSPLVCSIAALLAISSSTAWYVWALKYGTLGFITSISLLPIVLALAARILSNDDTISAWHAGLLVLATTLMLLWSASGLALLPAIVCGLIFIKTVFKKTHLRWALPLIIALNVPWIIVFLNISKVTDFLEKNHHTSTQAAISHIQIEVDPTQVVSSKPPSFGRIKSAVFEWARSSNPLLVFFALPALLLLPDRRWRILWISSALGMLTLGSILYPIKPHMELQRFMAILNIALTVPVANIIAGIFLRAQNYRISFAASSVFSFLIVGCISCMAMVLNRSLDQYTFAEQPAFELAEQIKQHAGDGRTFFAGYVLQDLYGGHIAPLALWSQKPLLAYSYVHNTWSYADIIPKHMRDQGDTGIRDYHALYNASLIVAHEAKWIKYYRQRLEQYQELWSGAGFVIFKNLAFVNSYFLEGSGEIIEQSENSVRFKLNSERAVIKFRYFEFLEALGCQVTPYRVVDGTNFVELNNCPLNQEIELRSKDVFRRVFGANKG